jgi:hypothetical protein
LERTVTGESAAKLLGTFPIAIDPVQIESLWVELRSRVSDALQITETP